MRSKAMFLALLALVLDAQAVPVSESEAKFAAKAWGGGQERLGVYLGPASVSAAELKTSTGAKFYAIRMQDAGTVFMSADTRIEPVLAFSSTEDGAADANSPLRALLDADVSARQAAIDSVKLTANGTGTGSVPTAAEAKWAELLAGMDKLAAAPNPVTRKSELDDLLVEPLLKTKWGQSTAGGNACYNYYTPEYTYTNAKGQKVTERCVCGCVATAMAQLLRFWEAPEGNRNAFSESCSRPVNVKRDAKTGRLTSDTKTEVLSTEAGAYSWSDMIGAPTSSATENQRKAIGKLTYDCGVSVGMNYDVADKGGSGIFASESKKISTAFRNRFGYANAAIVTSSSGVTSPLRARAILPNLDAGCPVLLCITGGMGGHAVVADGYGLIYDDTVTNKYVHLNMGWEGQNDVWYNLPLINVNDNPENFNGFDTVNDVIYNVFPDRQGEIVSGRVLDRNAKPVEGATVTIRFADGEELDTALTTARGLYSFIVPSGRAYELSATKGDDLVSLPIRTSVLADSMTSNVQVGNSWGNDLTLDSPSVKIGKQIFGSLDVALAAAEEGDGLEVFAPTKLEKAVKVDKSCLIFSSDPAACPITRVNGAKLTVAAGCTLTLSNAVFAGAVNALVEVADGGNLTLKGGVSFGIPYTVAAAVVTENADGFTIAGELSETFAIDCRAARNVGEQFGKVTDMSYAAASNAAARVVNIFSSGDDGMAGTVVEGETPFALRWGYVPVSFEDAAACYVLDGKVQTNCFRRLDSLFASLARQSQSAATIWVMRDGTLSRQVELNDDLTIRSSNQAVVSYQDAPAGFVVESGRTLKIDGLTFDGFTGDSLLIAKGGNLILSGTTVIRNFFGTNNRLSAAVRVTDGGCLTVGSAEGGPVVFSNCVNQASNQSIGGAICATGDGTKVVLANDVQISECASRGKGGGVYLDDAAQICLSGLLKIRDNVANTGSSPIASDIHCTKSSGGVVVRGPIEPESSIGLRLGATGWNQPGFAFARVETPDAGAVSAFFCDGGTVDLVPEQVNSTLVWTERSDVIPPVSPDEAQVHIAGTANGYYKTLTDALTVLDGKDGVIEILCGFALTNDVAICGRVTLTSGAGDPFALTREGCFGFKMTNACELAISNLVLDGAGLAWNWFLVDGGSVILGAGAVVSNVHFTAESPGSAVYAQHKAQVVLQDGARIVDCRNVEVSEYSGNGRSGAITADDDSVVWLEGGSIDGCAGRLGGGIYLANKSEVKIGGSVTVTNNFGAKGEACNVYVPGYCNLYLTAPLTGKVGLTRGYGADEFVFGRVDANLFNGSQAELVRSARRFVNDGNGDIGCVVQRGNDLLLVWSDGLDVNGRYTDADDNVYESVLDAQDDEMPVPAVRELTYNAQGQYGLEDGHGYVASGVLLATNAGTFQTTLTLKPGFSWETVGTANPLTKTWTIAKAPLTVRANAASKVKGAADPVLTYQVEGLCRPDLATNVLRGQLERQPGEEIGSYGIGKGTLEVVGGNYELTFVPATLTITPKEEPEPDPEWTVVTNTPSPIAFKSIDRLSDTEWKLVVTSRVEYCNYRLIWTDDLTKGFTSTGGWEHAVGPAATETWTTNVITTGGARFWRAEGAEGTNMVLKTVK